MHKAQHPRGRTETSCPGRPAAAARIVLDKSHVLTQIETMEVQFDEVAAFDKEIRKLHQEQEKYVSLRSGLYEDLKQGIITEEDFRDFRQIYEKQYQAAEDAIRQQEEAIKDLF